MLDVLDYVASLIVSTAAAFAIVLLDERWLPPAELDRAWPPTSRASAIVAFGPLCLPVHFWRTRRSLAGVLWGLGWAALVVAANVGVTALLDAAFG